MVSVAEVRYTLEGCAHGLREDGRALLDYRHCSLEVGVLPQAGGSSRLRTIGTDLLVGVVATLSTPDELFPDMGRIAVTVGCGPGDATKIIFAMAAHGRHATDLPPHRLLRLSSR